MPADVNHGEGYDRPPFVIGLLESGPQVEYEKGGGEKVGTRGVLNRPKYEKVPYTYDLVDPETGEMQETVEVEPDDYDRPSESMPQVIDRLGEERGWNRLTDVGLVLAYGMAGRLKYWPETAAGLGEFVGIADAKVSLGARHGSTVGLYLIDGVLEPYFLPHDNTHAGDGIPDEPVVEPLPDGPVADALTFDADAHGGVAQTVRHIEEEDSWYKVGYPHDLTECRKVSAQDVQVARDYEQHLRYSVYYTDSGGRKCSIR